MKRIGVPIGRTGAVVFTSCAQVAALILPLASKALMHSNDMKCALFKPPKRICSAGR